jgi:hypothetical protein
MILSVLKSTIEEIYSEEIFIIRMNSTRKGQTSHFFAVTKLLTTTKKVQILIRNYKTKNSGNF